MSISVSNFSHESTVPLARCLKPIPLVRSFTRALGAFLASVAPWPACASVSCGGRSAVAADRKQNGGTTPFGAAQASWWLRVATSLPAHACSTVRRGATRAERAPCRRRARAAPFHRAPPKPPNPDTVSTKMEPWSTHDDVQPLKPPVPPQRRRNHLAGEPRSRQPPRGGYI